MTTEYKPVESKKSKKSIARNKQIEATLPAKRALISKLSPRRAEEELLELSEITMEWKATKLVQMIDMCLSGENLKDNSPNPQGLISAISELNKMQGHYTPEKHAHFHAHMSAEEIKELQERIKPHQKEY